MDRELGHLEREACRARRGRAGLVRLAGDGFVAAVFRHRTSRAGDPQLHSHAVVGNTTRAQERWSTLDSRALYREARTAGFLYQAALRAELTERLGVEWGPVRRGSAEVVGVLQAVVREFSRRRREIVERLAERGESSAGAARIAALDTRRRKEYDVPVDRLRADWRARAAEQSLDREALHGSSGLRGRILRRVSSRRRSARWPARRGSAAMTAPLIWWAQAHRDGARPGQVVKLTDAWSARRMLSRSAKLGPARRRAWWRAWRQPG